jgi:hypothetical protein
MSKYEIVEVMREDDSGVVKHVYPVYRVVGPGKFLNRDAHYHDTSMDFSTKEIAAAAVEVAEAAYDAGYRQAKR